MRASGTNRSLLVGSVAGVAALAMASTAFACTTYKGKLTLAASGGGVATAEGAPGIHEYCYGDTRQNIAIASTFVLSVAPGTTCGTRVKDGSYNVRWLNLAPNSLSTLAPNNCNSTGIPMGTMQISNGSGSANFVMPQSGGAPAPVGHVNICVDSAAASNAGTPERDSAPELYLNLI